MLKEYEASIVQKNEEMFHKQKQPILTLVSGSNSLTKQRVDSLSKDIHNLKESLEFSQREHYDKF